MISLAGSSNPSVVAQVVQSPTINPNSGRDDHTPAGKNANGTEESPAITVARRSPPVLITPPATVRGLSPLAELNALMVIKRRKRLDKLHITSFLGARSNALHMFSQADETGCTLLLRVNGELKDVAKGKIVTSLNRVFHGRPMADDVFRVTISRALPGCGSLYPPFQPDKADSELNLKQCLLWRMI